ncbi:DUF4113 domain-containing protein [Methylobacterium sp. J-088]|uniref:DUF4113 domain-containing protein n=1 Tax=Methylobacterium sp. J-088 TaxID=2836664 RepID=UPI001FBA1CDB|nr:DUF4113 domain-containing protein [Methylobacterium sp. J-088]MCJ2064883.1 DUF4113 domain-containing protein [Methylobacterium sp. J-088]
MVTTDLLPLRPSQRAMPGLDLIDRKQGAALNAGNRRFGRGAVVPAAAGFAPARRWLTRFKMRSPRHTTRAEKIPVVAA